MPRLPKTIIHINQHVIRRNKKEGRQDPCVTVKRGKTNRYARSVAIMGPSTVVYSPRQTSQVRREGVDRNIQWGHSHWRRHEGSIMPWTRDQLKCYAERLKSVQEPEIWAPPEVSLATITDCLLQLREFWPSIPDIEVVRHQYLAGMGAETFYVVDRAILNGRQGMPCLFKHSEA